MATSFISQIPIIVNVVKSLRPKTVVDIGKGFGKYGFLLHEYVGISTERKIDPVKSLCEQSELTIDAVDVDSSLSLPHLPHIYRHLFDDDLLKFSSNCGQYDVALLIDIIEHVDKNDGLAAVENLLRKCKYLVISTPDHFFEQHLYESEFEEHRSLWTPSDFRRLGKVQFQNIQGGGTVYLLSLHNKTASKIIGSGLGSKMKRILRVVQHELLRFR